MEAAALVLATAVPTEAVVLVAGGATVSMTFVEIQVKVAFTKVRGQCVLVAHEYTTRDGDEALGRWLTHGKSRGWPGAAHGGSTRT